MNSTDPNADFVADLTADLTTDRERALAAALIAARVTRQRLAPQTDPGYDVAAGYRVARQVLDWRRARGERPIGRKLGFTNRGIWPEYGVTAPMWAHLYDSTVRTLPTTQGVASLGVFVEPRIEPEIVLHFARAPATAAGPRALLDCIDWIAHGYEIVDSVYPGWKFRLPDTIGAFGLHGALFVGPAHPVESLAASGDALVRALADFTIELRCNGVVRDRGRGSNVLDSPLIAVEAFLRLLAEQAAFVPLAAGEIVTTGTLTAALPIRAGEVWSTALAGIALPGLTLAFEA